MYACLLASWTQFERCLILEKLLAVICWDYVPETLKVLINYDSVLESLLTIMFPLLRDTLSPSSSRHTQPIRFYLLLLLLHLLNLHLRTHCHLQSPSRPPSCLSLARLTTPTNIPLLSSSPPPILLTTTASSSSQPFLHLTFLLLPILTRCNQEFESRLETHTPA